MCERLSPLSGGQRKITFICEYLMHCICELMSFYGIYVMVIHIAFKLNLLQMCKCFFPHIDFETMPLCVFLHFSFSGVFPPSVSEYCLCPPSCVSSFCDVIRVWSWLLRQLCSSWLYPVLVCHSSCPHLVCFWFLTSCMDLKFAFSLHFVFLSLLVPTLYFVCVSRISRFLYLFGFC